MNIKLKKIRMINFKGIRDLEIDFRLDRPTFISGENATGKTTIMDAFLWLLFGKDSFNRTDFNIKTLDEKGQVIWKLPHEVEGVLDFDGEQIVLRRVLNEKWQKKRGSADEEFNGHETGYFVNDVPRTQKEYMEIVGDLCPESLFKMITNPGFFPALKKESQREVLMKISGEISDRDIAGDNKQFNALLDLMNGKSLDDFRREIGAKKKRIKAELEEIPPRIDEIKRNIPESHDWKSLKASYDQNETEIRSIDDQLNDHTNRQQALMQQYDEKLHDLAAARQRRFSQATKVYEEMAVAYNAAREKIADLQNSISRARAELSQELANKEIMAGQNAQRLNEIEGLREQWQQIFKQEIHFDENQFVCPTCKREFEAGDVDTRKKELTEHFNMDKESRLASITEQGKMMKYLWGETDNRIVALSYKIKQLDDHIQESESELKKLQENMPEKVTFDSESIISPELKRIDLEIQGIQKQIDQFALPVNGNGENSQLKIRKSALQLYNMSILLKLSMQDVIQSNTERIATLEARQRDLSQELADLEKLEFTMTAFSKAKITEVEKRINSLFSLVRFKMFDTQINGGEVETCEATVGGVPYSDLNNAMRINAGLDIINVLSNYHNYMAPVWIDNREAVNDLIETDSQLINLVVTRDKQLIINN